MKTLFILNDLPSSYARCCNALRLAIDRRTLMRES